VPVAALVAGGQGHGQVLRVSGVVGCR